MRLDYLKYVLAYCFLIFIHVTGHAVDSMSLEVAAVENVKIVRLGAQWNWDSRWFQSNGSHVGGYWDLSLAQWRGDKYQNVSGQTQNLTSIGITPVFRWQQDNKKGVYIEAGIGAHLLSELYNNDGNIFSTKFQFGDHLGVGYVFNNKFDLGLKLQHFSNAGIKEPNPGLNVAVISAKYSF